MSATTSLLTPVALCLASAVFYVAGTAAMKLYGHAPFALLMVPVGLAFLLAAWFEVAVLRSTRVGQVFLLIFAFEVVLTALLAFVVLQERYSVREMLGLATIVTGIAILVSADHDPCGPPGDVPDARLPDAARATAVTPAPKERPHG